MPKVKPLPVKKLRAAMNPAAIRYKDSTTIPRQDGTNGHQPRALHAFELGLHIRGGEYHIYLSGEPGLGRTYFVRSLLASRAGKAQTPPDLLYVHNFGDEDRPQLLSVPAGTGRKLKKDLSAAVNRLRDDIPARLQQESFIQRRENLILQFKTRREDIFSEMETAATREGFTLILDEDGSMTLSPLVEGKLISQPEFERLPPALQKKLRTIRDQLLSGLTEQLRKIQVEERAFKKGEENLEREVVTAVLRERLGPLKKKYARVKPFTDWLAEAQKDILDSLDQIIPREESPAGQPLPGATEAHAAGEDVWARCQANLFVDNSETKGAPVVIQDHPTYFNLLGCIERESELGALYTDHSLIKAGSLHKANGGYLVLRVEDVLQHQNAWEGLLRALRAGTARIEDPGEQDHARTRTIEPEALPLDLKVILIGDDETYEALLYHDPRFRKLFKIKAHMQETVARNSENIRNFLTHLAEIISEMKLRPFEKGALAGLVDESSRLASDQRKLSLQYPLLRDLMIEASALAEIDDAETVTAEILEKAKESRDFRNNLYEELFMEDYDSEIIKAPTSGTAVGRVNGLAVTYYGDYAFGLPHQIACTVGVGEEGIIDLEREAMLGGPIHTKAMMILKSYLLGRFAHDKPLVLTGSLYFEQSYAHVEGDSASGAELAALLSALSGVPIDLSFAFTGAVNQSGAIMAVGDVTRKIEGFYEVCKRRGLTGSQGVLIPHDNVVNLMLKPEVVRAVEEGMFRIFPVRTIDEAMEILTGQTAGKATASGRFPKGTLFRKVDDRLAELAEKSRQYRHGKGRR